MNSQFKNYDQGFYFPLILRALFMIAFLILLVNGFRNSVSVFALILPVVILMVAFSRCGVTINGSAKTYKMYWSPLRGIRIGFSNSFSDWEYLSLFKMKPIVSVGIVAMEDKSEEYESRLMLLNKAHTKKKELLFYDDHEIAREKIVELSKFLGLEIVSYDPPRGVYR